MSRIGTLDIETSPHDAWAFNVWQQNILPMHIKTPTCMLTWAFKWLDEANSKTIYRKWDDEDFHEKLLELLDEADVIVGYNHEKFDMRHINREFVERGYPPPRPVGYVDVMKTVKKQFNFPHNGLDYVCQRVLGKSKLDTGGFELWPAFMAGDKKAVSLMKKYNIQDVVLTDELYSYLRPWIKNHPYTGGDVVIDDADQEYRCPACGTGGEKILRTRPRYTRCFAIRQNNCGECGHWFDGKRTKVA